MRIITVIATAFATGVLAIVPLEAADGVVVVQRTTSDGGTRTSEVQIEPQRMRAEMDGEGRGPRVLVFDGAKQVMHLIDPARKTYTEMTKADVDRMGAQLSGAMAKMEAMLQSLPPAQRAQMEAMMKGRGMPAGAGAPAARTEYRKLGTSKVGKWTCDTYEGLRNGQKVSEVCTVAPQALGLRPADFAVTTQVADFFRGLVPEGADAVFQVGRPEQQGFSGIPVRQSTTIGGRTVVNEVVEVARRTFDDAIFAVPAGFTKETLPGGR